MHYYLNDCVYMQEHNRVMNEADRIVGLEPVLVGYLPACVLRSDPIWSDHVTAVTLETLLYNLSVLTFSS